MKTKWKAKILVCGLAPYLIAAAPVLAQSNIEPGAQPMTAQQLASLDVRASELMDMNVKSARGENLGEVEDIVVDAARASVYYVVIATDEALGLDGKLITVPIRSLRPTGRGDGLLLNVDQSQLKNAPGFSENQWPDWNAGTYRGRVDSYFFKEDELQRLPHGGRLTRVSDILGKNVNDQAQHNAGKIVDLVVNLGNEHVRYAVLEFDKAWSLDNKLVALPMGAFRFPTRPDLDIFLLMDRERVARARPFDRDNWPELNSDAHRREMEASLSGILNWGNRQSGQSGGDGPTSSGTSR